MLNLSVLFALVSIYLLKDPRILYHETNIVGQGLDTIITLTTLLMTYECVLLHTVFTLHYLIITISYDAFIINGSR